METRGLAGACHARPSEPSHRTVVFLVCALLAGMQTRFPRALRLLVARHTPPCPSHFPLPPSRRLSLSSSLSPFSSLFSLPCAPPHICALISRLLRKDKRGAAERNRRLQRQRERECLGTQQITCLALQGALFPPSLSPSLPFQSRLREETAARITVSAFCCLQTACRRCDGADVPALCGSFHWDFTAQPGDDVSFQWAL